MNKHTAPISMALPIARPSTPEVRNKRMRVLGCALAAALVLLAGCSTRSLNPAPVEDRGLSRSAPSAVDSAAVKLLPGAENAGKPGYYSVKPGDTIIRIGLENGQNWRDVVRWNNLETPNLIEVGQVLRVVPPMSETHVVIKPVTPVTVATTPA